MPLNQVGFTQLPYPMQFASSSNATAAGISTHGGTDTAAQPGKKNRLGGKNRRAARNKQLALAADLPATDGPVGGLGHADAAGSSRAPLQSEENASPVTPTSIVESADGELLTVVTFEREVSFRRAILGLDYSNFYPVVRDWLVGSPLVRLVKYDRERARGKLGNTPTIIRGLGCEIVVEAQILKVHYAEHGSFTYTRTCDSRMPSETPPDGHPQPLVWLPRQFTFGSPVLDLPLPNIVADWVQTGRRLTPRKGVQVRSSASARGALTAFKRITSARPQRILAVLACILFFFYIKRRCDVAKAPFVGKLCAHLSPLL
jgi:hypothetical protein